MQMNSKPIWARTAVVYQIYPRSFKDSDGDGVGDLKGIIEKLDYLNDGTEASLGVDAIWLSPIYQSPMLDFGYDVSDHCAIDPIFGTMEDFDHLVLKAHEHGIKILMDFIPGHTSSDHPWFIEAKSSRNNPKRNWYIWHDGKPDGTSPNNWISHFGGSRWEWDNTTKQYYLRTFLKEQPDLNWHNPEVKEAQLAVLRFWLEKGVDGFRIDSFNDIYKDKRFLDEPLNPEYEKGVTHPFNVYNHIYTQDQPERNELVKLFGKVMAEYGDKFMLTESYVSLPELISLYEAGDSFHAPFNFKFIHLKWNVEAYKMLLSELYSKVKSEYLLTFVLGNHDLPRVVSRLGEPAARTAAMLQLTLKGMPIIYYGEELGMVDTPIPLEKIQDPLGKKDNGIQPGRDPQRTPMPWSSDESGGFTVGEPWLPMGVNTITHSVATEQRDPHSFLSFYKKLILLRKSSDVLLHGDYIPRETNNEHVLAYTRETEKEKLLITLNFSSTKQQIQMDLEETDLLMMSTVTDRVEKRTDESDLHLLPFEGRIYRISSL